MLNTPQMLNNLVSSPDTPVRLRADLLGPGTRPPLWKWTVTFFGGAPVMIPATVVGDPLQAQSSTIEFPIKDVGQYGVSVDVDSGLRCSDNTIISVNAPGRGLYLLRVTPPASLAMGIPAQEVRRVSDPGNPTIEDIDLLSGTKVSIAPQDASRHFIPSYVHVSQLSSGVAVDGDTAYGPFDAFLLANGVYDVLIVPQGALAPMVLTAATAATFPVTLSVDEGIMVNGSSVDGDGVPLGGTRVMLRAGIRPSTLGVSDDAGQFSLRTRPGVQSAVIEPPPGAGLPEARVAINPGIAIDGNTTIKMAWKSFARGEFSVTVKTSDGSAPVAGCRVHVESEEASIFPDVGLLTVFGTPPTTIVATGPVRAEVVTDAAGLARFPNLPNGTSWGYKITVVPPETLPDAALTTADVVLSGTGSAMTIPLGRRVTLTGTLLPKSATTGVRVIARDQSGGIAARLTSAIVGDQGNYSLTVEPGQGRVYQLMADPPTGSGLARTVLDQKNAPSIDSAIATYTVNSAVSFTGFVRTGTRMIGDAMVQAFCLGRPPACGDSTWPVAEAVTDADGRYVLALPAPGHLP